MNAPRYVIVEKKCCGTCIHYRQHYILTEQCRPYPLWYGHCGTPRMKRRQPDEVCPYAKLSNHFVGAGITRPKNKTFPLGKVLFHSYSSSSFSTATAALSKCAGGTFVA